MDDKLQYVGNLYSNEHQSGRVYDNNGIAPTLSAEGGGSMRQVKTVEYTPQYRIRKLTERETFRLMDVDEHSIDTIQAAGISRTQQYKLAGNSIVVSCLYHLLRKLLIQKNNEQDNTLW